jgi:hypothetical protein
MLEAEQDLVAIAQILQPQWRGAGRPLGVDPGAHAQGLGPLVQLTELHAIAPKGCAVKADRIVGHIAVPKAGSIRCLL